MNYLLFLIIFIIIYSIRNLKFKLNEPIFLYTFMWSIILVLYLSQIIGILTPLSVSFYFSLILSYLMFIMGSSIGKRITIPSISYEYNKSKLFLAASFLFLVITSAFMLTIVKLGAPPVLGGLSREHYYIGYLEILYLTVYVFWFIGFYLIFQKYRVKSILIMILLSLVIVVLKGNKFPIIYFLCLILYFKSQGKSITIKTTLLYTAVIITVFAGAMYLYVDNFESYIGYKTDLVDFSLNENLWFLIDPLLYLTSNFMNFSNYLDADTSHSFGLSSLSGILSFTQTKDLFLNKFTVIEAAWKENLIYPWLTTGTYLKEVFIDFGFIGIVLFPFFYGFFSGKYFSLVVKTNYKCSIFNLFLSFTFFYSICISFFTFYFNSIELVSNLILVYFINRFATKKVRRISSSNGTGVEA
jgi:oligosaccharide repeat unit polymerase